MKKEMEIGPGMTVVMDYPNGASLAQLDADKRNMETELCRAAKCTVDTLPVGIIQTQRGVSISLLSKKSMGDRHGFTTKQRIAYDAIMAGENPAINWPCASGKTYLFTRIKEDLAAIHKAIDEHFEGEE